MSGIVGMLDLRGAPADAPLLRRMTASMAYRGPDGHAVWTEGPVGFGHTLLQTTAESAGAQQPCSLDGRVWITADARIDDRRNLVATLESMGQSDVSAASDAHLILHAYQAWGDACVERLIGDFAFAIWDGQARRLFCARDRFGVKPFYYACSRGFFVFSNTLECVRLHSAVGDALNERAIGDFLLFGFNEDTATTTFADVQRLPPAHSLTVDAGTARQHRYWTLPVDGRIRYRRWHDYVEHFADLLRAAVDDRLGAGRAGIWMSGGLDSTSIAAIATEILSGRRQPCDFRAYSIVYDRLIADEERRHAGLAAQALDVPIHYFAADGYPPFHGWDRPELRTPEPAGDPFFLVNSDQMREAAPHTRVLLGGDGGDEVLRPSAVAGLLPWMPLPQLATGVARSLLVHRQRPPFGVRRALRKWFGDAPAVTLPYPGWLNRTFEERYGLRARWARHGAHTASHPLRPDAYRKMTMPLWPSYFESWDPGVTRVAIEGRYPFLDVRLVEYLMAIPPMPWCVNKQILRESMRGRLPDAIRRRPKTPLAGDPLVAHVMKSGSARLDGFEAAPQLAAYVERSVIPSLAGLDQDNAWLNVRPLCLNHWLKEEGHHAVNQFHQGKQWEDTVREPAAHRVR
jgi:asparagine synthase (glutamine-hydrolysing)